MLNFDSRVVVAGLSLIVAAAVLSAYSSAQTAPAAQIEGMLVTPANQQELGVYLYVAKSGCEGPGELYTEIQYPAALQGEPSRGARVRSMFSGESQELWLHQKRMGDKLLLTNLCMSTDWLQRTSVTLVYSGAGSPNNLVVSDFTLWPVDK